VRRWLPALRRVPDAWLFEPWRMPPDMQALWRARGQDIATPLVDLAATRPPRRAYTPCATKNRYAAKADRGKHGSRLVRRTAGRRQLPFTSPQQSLDF
jgi:deoxyribodipyrimidine photo-lyase